jgi:hypothetical protein
MLWRVRPAQGSSAVTACTSRSFVWDMSVRVARVRDGVAAGGVGGGRARGAPRSAGRGARGHGAGCVGRGAAPPLGWRLVLGHGLI